MMYKSIIINRQTIFFKRVLVKLLAALLTGLVLLLVLRGVTASRLKKLYQHQQKQSAELMQLESQSRTNNKKLTELYSTLLYLQGPPKEYSGYRTAVAGESPGIQWVRYSHYYASPDELHFDFFDGRNSRGLKIKDLEVWLASNNERFRDSYIYDSSIVTGVFSLENYCYGSRQQYSGGFRSYYLEDWVTYYDDLDMGCKEYIHARAVESVEEGRMKCTVYFYVDPLPNPVGAYFIYKNL